MPLFVAIVLRRDGERSRRADESNSAWVGARREDAVEPAMEAVQHWGRRRYQVLVGELTEVAETPPVYTLRPLDESDSHGADALVSHAQVGHYVEEPGLGEPINREDIPF